MHGWSLLLHICRYLLRQIDLRDGRQTNCSEEVLFPHLLLVERTIDQTFNQVIIYEELLGGGNINQRHLYRFFRLSMGCTPEDTKDRSNPILLPCKRPK